MSLRLWLVRHGATDWSDAGRLNGWTDVPLNEWGRRQARSLTQSLASRQFTGVWSSDLVRATETARLAAKEAVGDSRLRELDFGRLEGSRWEECRSEVRRALLAFEGFRAPGGESMAELRSRVLGFVDELPGGEHLVFTHGGVIRLLLRGAGLDRRLPPGAFVRVALDPTRGAIHARAVRA
jgi:2,3-bisphosphoglycerate-dependent phosphoglycerate mutase